LYLLCATFLILLTTNTASSDELTLKYKLKIPGNVVYVTDIDGDGLNEMFVGTSKVGEIDFLYLYRYQNCEYVRVWRYNISDDGRWGGITSLTVGDTDNDGEDEIVVSTGQPSDTGGDRSLRVFEKVKDTEDSFKPVYKYEIGQRTDPASVKVGDADNDGKNEIVVGLSWYGSKILQFKYSPESGSYEVSRVEETGSDVKSIDIADVDGDGLNEIVAGTSCWKDYGVRVIEYIGGENNEKFKKVWSKPLGYTVAATGDLDADGKLEILAVSGTHCGNVDTPKPGVWIFRYNISRYMNTWNISNFPAGANFGQGGCNPVIGNLMGNATNEFAFTMNVNGTHKKVYIYGFDGEFKEFQSVDANPFSLTIADSDNNGLNELIICDSFDKTIKIYELKPEPPAESNPESNTSENVTEEQKDPIAELPGFEAVYVAAVLILTVLRRR
jgi:hypothetical protein